MSETPEWTTAEYLGNIAAEELQRALDAVGVITLHVGIDGDGDVQIIFASLKDVETMLSLGLEEDGVGTLYDRSTSACVTRSELPDDASDEELEAARKTGWAWSIHPHLSRRRVGWHVAGYLPPADANQLTANLNALRLGGAL